MATYRVSPSLGTDSAGNNGSISQPWATWAYLDTRISPTAGDIYLQDAGSVAREGIPNSIIAADNITLDVYGDSGYATVTGFVQQSGWTYNAAYDVWEKSVADGWNVMLDNAPLTVDMNRPWTGLSPSSPCRGAGAYIQGARDRFNRRYAGRNIGPWAVLAAA